jgi:8-oxo-dGTP pyrophosphatase MutT (NUDIX family)
VAIVRDGAAGLETLMLLRPVEAEFAPRAQVFPGGRVDADDGDDGWAEIVAVDDGSLTGLAAEAGQPSPRALVVGAIREAFEEAAILLGLDAAQYPGAEWAAAARQRVHGGDEPFLDIVRSTGLRLRPAMAYFARWVTPEGMPRRYDTRFFAALMPEGQEPVAAEGEIQSLEWITPAAALARADTNDAYTLPPTRAVLTKLTGYTSVSQALEGLPQDSDVAPIVPKIVNLPDADGLGGITVLLPGEPGYE